MIGSERQVSRRKNEAARSERLDRRRRSSSEGRSQREANLACPRTGLKSQGEEDGCRSSKKLEMDGDVRYGTSVRVGRYVPIGNSRHGAFSLDGQAIMQPRSNGWIPSSPARACLCVKDKTRGPLRWMAFVHKMQAGDRSAGFSRDSRKSFDGAGQGWCNGNGNR